MSQVNLTPSRSPALSLFTSPEEHAPKSRTLLAVSIALVAALGLAGLDLATGSTFLGSADAPKQTSRVESMPNHSFAPLPDAPASATSSDQLPELMIDLTTVTAEPLDCQNC